MSVVLEEKKDPTAKFGAQVDEQIAQATGRIRAHDLTFGGLTLGAMLAVYATAMILCDKYLNLPEWVRQLSLVSFLFATAGVGYWLILRPLRKRINPLYAASRVERTIDDAKNSVTGYVEAQENGEIHIAVKAAMSARAAKAVVDADVNKAIDHRSLIVAGGVLILFLLTLAVLFFVFRPTQFRSLLGRAFVPFSSDPIATRTQINLLKPDPPEQTITTGQTITVTVHIGGKVPAKTGPERVRVLLRHNPADPNYEEIAMEEGETSRDWQVKVPEYLVQNGFWYKVAAGDAATQEHKVNVRTLPLFTDYEATFEYPPYMRKPSDKTTGPNIRTYRGTKVTFLAKTNREVVEGSMKFESPGLAPVLGLTPPDANDALKFRFTATEASRYRLYMTTTTLEKNVDPPPFTLALDSDLAPNVLVTKPEEVETTAVANGLLQVDGIVGDDFGIDKVRLRMRVDGRDIAPVPYTDGKSFLRAKDNTWPTDLAFKLSADFSKLSYTDGAKLDAKPGTVIEYWVEAIDNCTETKPVEDWNKQVGNVGRSNVQRVTLAPPEMEPEKKQQIDEKKDQRSNEEKQHNQQQQQKLDKEDRTKKPQDGGQPPKTDNEPPKKQEGQPDAKDGEPKGGQPDAKSGDAKGGKPPEPKKNDTGSGSGTEPMSKMPPDPTGKPPEKSDTGMGMGGMTDPKMSNDPNMTTKPPEPKGGAEKGMDNMPPKGMNPQSGTAGGMDNNSNPMPMAPPPKTPEERQAEQDAARDAERVKNELDRNKAEGGNAKPNSNANADQNRTEPAQPKPQPPQTGMGDMEPKSKDAPKPEPMDPMGDGKNAASESKTEGKLENKPNPDAASKPGLQQPNPMKPNEKPAPTSESRDEPLGGTPGQEKPEQKTEGKVDPKDPKNQNKDPNSGSTGKPSTDKPEPKDGQPTGAPNDKKDPTASAGEPKPNREPTRGEDKTPPQAKPGDDQQPKENPAAGEAKPDRAAPSAETKPMPKKDMMMGDAPKPPDMSEAKPAPPEKGATDPKNEGASEAKPDGATPPMGGKDIDKGGDKPETPQKQKDGKADPKSGSKGNGEGKKLVEKQQKELEEAVKNLDSLDPAKKKDAQDKLDKTFGEDKRKAIEDLQKQRKEELEQLKKDLDSPDKATQDAARNKLDDLMKQAEEHAKKNGDSKGKELTQEEINDLMQKARDLNSKDEKKRQDAEKALDDKLGKDAREKLQNDLKQQPPMDPKQQEELKKKIDELAKKMPGAGKGPIDPKNDHTPGASIETPKSAMDDDPRNRAKTAQLQLEEFEKHLYDKDLHDKLGWDPEKYRKFVEDQQEAVRRLAKEADAHEEALRNVPKPPTGSPTFKTADGGKVDNSVGPKSGATSSSGATFAPPGFEEAKKKFQDETRKLKQKQ